MCRVCVDNPSSSGRMGADGTAILRGASDDSGMSWSLDSDDYQPHEGSMEMDEEVHVTSAQSNYTILSSNDILRRKTRAIDQLAAMFRITRTEASVLLHHFHWDTLLIEDSWFSDEAGTRQAAGLVPAPDVDAAEGKTELPCGMCWVTCKVEDLEAARCGHYFCEQCWRGYIHTEIVEDPKLLTFLCPDMDCGAAVGYYLPLSLASEDDRQQYMKRLVRSYVRDNVNIKWCPKACGNAIEWSPDSHSFDVICHCGLNFCWNCLKFAHRPVDCKVVARWLRRVSVEPENLDALAPSAKPCPECRQPVVKGLGAVMHVKCAPPCCYEFCWLCSAPWRAAHGGGVGCSSCNAFRPEEGETSKSPEKFVHYYNRWLANGQCLIRARSDLSAVQSQVAQLRVADARPSQLLLWKLETLEQIVEGRRLLKWSHCTAYYMQRSVADMEMFHKVQGELELAMEQLQSFSDENAHAIEKYEDQRDGRAENFKREVSQMISASNSMLNNLSHLLNDRGVREEGAQVQGVRDEFAKVHLDDSSMSA